MKYWKPAFSILGVLALAIIVRDYGATRLYQELSHAGWLALPLILTFIPTLICYSLAWQLCTDATPNQQSNLALSANFFRFTVISIAWNNLSPFLKVLGEPIKVSMLSELIDRKSAIRSVVIYNIVHLIGTVGAFLLVAILIPWIFDPSPSIKIACYASIAIFLALIGLLLWLPNVGQRLLLNKRIKRIRLAGLWLRWGFHKIARFYREKKAALVIAIALEIFARFIEGLTFFVAFKIVAQPLPFLHSTFLEVGRALFDNIFFFVPYQMGSREFGVSILLDSVLNTPKGAYVAAALLYRMVEIVWMLIGYVLWVKTSALQAQKDR